jgi:hypothetical protein
VQNVVSTDGEQLWILDPKAPNFAPGLEKDNKTSVIMLMKRQELLRCKLQRRKSEDGTRRGNTQSELCNLSRWDLLHALRQLQGGLTSFSSTHLAAGGVAPREISRGIAPGPGRFGSIPNIAQNHTIVIMGNF